MEENSIMKNKKITSIIAAVTMIVVVGIGYIYIRQKEQNVLTPIIENEIKMGQSDIDVTKVNELQEAVDKGHQPWRLDPLMVAKAEALTYGFVEQDNFTLKAISKASGIASGIARVEVIHNRISYLITLIQITPGEGKIWILQKIEK